MHTSTAKEKIIIIGAGAAGLMAAKQLSPDYEVTLLEARDEAGGRMRAGGAEFVHGRLPLTLALLKEARLSYTEVEGRFFQVKKGTLEEQEEMFEDWNGLLEKMSQATSDTTIQAFLDEHYAHKSFAVLRKRVIAYVQGFDLADPGRVSVHYLYNEWTHEDEENFRIDGTYTALIRFMEQSCTGNGCRILTGKIVVQVEWAAGTLTVHTAAGDRFSADRLIVTTPLPLLQQRAILFAPELPAYAKAAGQIGWGAVVKVVLTFTHPFWEELQKGIGFVISEEEIPTWWTQAPSQQPVLTGWLGGPPALSAATLSSEKTIVLALRSLSNIFTIATNRLQEMLIDGQVYHWANDPFAKGAYSYDTPDSAAARQLLLTPVENTLYFAGEALYQGTSPGTVEAALTTGKAVADRIKNQS